MMRMGVWVPPPSVVAEADAAKGFSTATGTIGA
jgi:hypothetical protein